MVAITCGLEINELVSNAFKHAFGKQKENQLTVELHTDDGTVTLTVADNGSGIPEEVQLSATRSLGLQLVYAMVTDQLQGELTVQRRGGHATRSYSRTLGRARSVLAGPMSAISPIMLNNARRNQKRRLCVGERAGKQVYFLVGATGDRKVAIGRHLGLGSHRLCSMI